MRALTLLLLLSTTGCASNVASVMDGIMSSWAGASADEVFRQWGYPHEERTVAGRQLLLWHRDVTLSMPAVATTAGNVGRSGTYTGTTIVTGGGTANLNCTRVLEISDRRNVVGWSWHGNNCPFVEAGMYTRWRRLTAAAVL